jgi:hypothetical protein
MDLWDGLMRGKRRALQNHRRKSYLPSNVKSQKIIKKLLW